jgi:hypothetical protein
MNDLEHVRKGWDEVEALETGLLRQMTVQESLRQSVLPSRSCRPLSSSFVTNAWRI